MDIGTQIIEFIVGSGLVSVDPETIKEEYSGGLMVWSANAGEQITEFVKEKMMEQCVSKYFKKRTHE